MREVSGVIKKVKRVFRVFSQHNIQVRFDFALHYDRALTDGAFLMRNLVCADEATFKDGETSMWHRCFPGEVMPTISVDKHPFKVNVSAAISFYGGVFIYVWFGTETKIKATSLRAGELVQILHEIGPAHGLQIPRGASLKSVMERFNSK